MGSHAQTGDESILEEGTVWGKAWREEPDIFQWEDQK